MSCYHPLRAYALPSADNKKQIHFFKGLDISEYDNSDNPYKVLIPCGQCIGCRLDYARSWAVRCVLESLQYENNYFITLTYDNDHLPVKHNYNTDNIGELKGLFISHPLVKSDLSKFIKDLRRYYDYHFNYQNIRFFASGEYGEQNGRPHYHVIFFNLPIYDLIKVKNSNSSYPLFESEIISSIWKKGLVRIGELNFDTCAYTARYVMKKHKGFSSDYYEKNGLVPEFSSCSNHPGIGRSYYELNKDKIYKLDNLIIPKRNGSIISKPPKYYDRLFEVDNADLLQDLKLKRKSVFEAKFLSELSKTSKAEFDYLLDKELSKSCKIKCLTRSI